MILATALSALDATVVATAMPSIVGVLGGLPLYSLVISSYLLISTTTLPLYGKLSDMYGRKPVFMFSVGTFIGGSALCGLAWDMPSLIAFRALQGLGAGGVLTLSLTIIGDLFDVEERARLQGVFGSVWGISSVVGPLVGGAIVQFWDWRWVFFINVPIGIVSALLLLLYLREPRIHTRQRIDVLGALTLTVGVALVLMGLQTMTEGGGSADADGGLPVTTLLVWIGAVVVLALFALVERRAQAPMLSLSLLSRPVIAVPAVVGSLAGAMLMGISAYVPLLVQGAWLGTPILAGLLIAPLSIGWPLASSATGRLLRRVSYRSLAITGMALILAGSTLLLGVALPGVAANPILRGVVVAVSTFIIGAGMGMSTTSMLIAVQISVPWSERGIATASVQFFRNMGSTVGTAVLGTVLTATLMPMLAVEQMRLLIAKMPPVALKAGADPSLGPVNALFDLSVRQTLAPQTRDALAGALASSLWWVYFGIMVMALVAVLIATRFPHRVGRPQPPAPTSTSVE
jgi:MFS family permease